MSERGSMRDAWQQRLDVFSGTPLTVVVWLIASAAVVYLLAGRAQTFEYVGVARALQYQLSSPIAGTVNSLEVDVYNHVEQGQILARLDDEPLRAELETARARLNRLASQLDSGLLSVGFREAGLVDDRRRFQVDEQRLQLDLLSLRVVLESDQIELERLNLRLDRITPLVEEGVVSRNDYDDLRLSRDRIARRIEENGTLLAQMNQEHEAARTRRRAYESQFPDLADKDPVLQPLKDAVRIQEMRIGEIETRRRGLVVRSPIDGQVSQVLARRGQSVRPGEPLLAVTERLASEIVAYASGASISAVVERARIAAARQDMPSRVAESVIIRVGPAIEQLPQRLWRDPSTPEYGRPFVVAGIPALNLTPGELVSLRILER